MRALIMSSALLLSGCASGWQMVPPVQLSVPAADPRVRITRADGARTVLNDARVERDTLYGSHRGTPVAVPIAFLRRTAIPGSSAQTRMYAAIGGSAVAAFFGFLLLLR